MLDCDLKYQSDDLVIENGDFALATGIDVLIQDIYNQIRIPYYSWALDYTFGSKIPEYVNMPDEPIKLVQLKNDIIEILKRDDRIVKDTWEIKIEKDSIEVKFLPEGRQEPIILTLKTQ